MKPPAPRPPPLPPEALAPPLPPPISLSEIAALLGIAAGRAPPAPRDGQPPPLPGPDRLHVSGDYLLDGRIVRAHIPPAVLALQYIGAASTLRLIRGGTMALDIVHTISLISPAFADWSLRAENRADGVVRALGRSEAQIGDPAFDDGVWVAAGDELSLIARLPPVARRAIAELMVVGGVVSGGALDVSARTGWAVHAIAPDLCALVDALDAVPADLDAALVERMTGDPIEGVRVRAAAHWLRRNPWTAVPAAAPIEAALIALLDDPAWRIKALASLGRVGTERAVAPLAAIADRWFGAAEKTAARAAITAITRRLGGLRAGGLSIADSPGGALSLE